MRNWIYIISNQKITNNLPKWWCRLSTLKLLTNISHVDNMKRMWVCDFFVEIFFRYLSRTCVWQVKNAHPAKTGSLHLQVTHKRFNDACISIHVCNWFAMKMQFDVQNTSPHIDNRSCVWFSGLTENMYNMFVASKWMHYQILPLVGRHCRYHSKEHRFFL